MRYLVLVGFCLVTAAIGISRERDFKAQLIGSWNLISFELRLPSGMVLKPYGESPVGRILYQNNGEMSAQLMTPRPDPFLDPDPLKATGEETDRAWRNYIGYWGKFQVNPASHTVEHHIEGASFPNWIGQNQIRAFRFDGDRLVLEAHTPAWNAVLVWQRTK